MVEFKGTTETFEKKSSASNIASTDVGSSDRKEGILHKLGDAIEKLGDKVEHRVSHKLGDAIEKLGDKVEHLKEKNNGYKK